MTRFAKAFAYGTSGTMCAVSHPYIAEQDWARGTSVAHLIFCLSLGFLITALVYLVQGITESINAVSDDKPVHHLLQAMVFGLSCFVFISFADERSQSEACFLFFGWAGIGSGLVAINQLARALFAWRDARRVQKRLRTAS